MAASSTRTCPSCGGLLAEDDPAALCPGCLLRQAIADEEPVVPGESVLGDYELLEELGRGGMGVVYRARQNRLDRLVAVKVLLGGIWASAEARQRFRTEARVAARLRHPNIVAVHEIGEQDGQPYFSMDLILGSSLEEKLRERPLEPRRAAEIMVTLAEALDHAHRQGGLHRDLKPSNVLLDIEGRPYVSDFGLARSLEAAGGLTATSKCGISPPSEQSSNASASTGDPPVHLPVTFSALPFSKEIEAQSPHRTDYERGYIRGAVVMSKRISCLAWLGLGVYLLASGASPLPADTDAKDLARLLEKGDRLLDRGAYRKAARTYKKADEASAGSSMLAALGLAAAHLELADHATALHYAERAIELGTSASLELQTRAFFTLGFVAFRMATEKRCPKPDLCELEAPEQALRKALELSGGQHVMTHYVMAEVLHFSRRDEEARKHLEAFFAHDGELEAARQLKCLLDAGARHCRSEQDIEPPRKTYFPPPDLPRGGTREVMVVLEMVIDAHGEIRCPRTLQQNLPPGLTRTILATVRRWKFEPARIDGQPVPVYYNLSFRFSTSFINSRF